MEALQIKDRKLFALPNDLFNHLEVQIAFYL